MAQQESIAFEGSRDELDDLFNYDPKDDDVFKPVESNLDELITLSPKRPKPADLGIDEEIQVAKKRKPIPKLDEDRLLSENGISKLRQMTRERLKFKGKGHEFSDVSRFLNLYQLWLDDLYPRAKFSDGIGLIEKLGHTKRIQIMRREWINESKLREPMDKKIREVEASVDKSTSPRQEQERLPTQLPDRESQAKKTLPASEESLFVEREELDFDGDELDALLAEDPSLSSAANSDKDFASKPEKVSNREEDFNDKYAQEMELMAGLDDW